MKEFVISNSTKFLEVADTINTPFKFLEVSGANGGYDLKATVWLRTAFITYEAYYPKEEFEDAKKTFESHGFVEATIREAPITLR